MSRTHGTLTLVLVAAGLLAYILIFERGPAGGGGPRTPQRLFPQLEPSRVTAFTIVQSNSTIRVERLQNVWQLAAPLYPASSLRIDNWLASVADLTRTSVLDATDLLAQPGGLAALGLQPARADITIEQGTARFQFRLGHRTPLGDKMYLQVVGADGVDITSALPLDRLPASALAWRDPAVIHLAGLRPDRLHM